MTVWVALREAAEITLELRATDVLTDAVILTTQPATTRTTRVGPFLHIAAVTARPTTALLPSVNYFYHLSFATSVSIGLAGAIDGDVARLLAYPPYRLPSFALPPPTLADLRVVQGSCRRPQSIGPDALSILDELVAVSADDALARPHQLIFSGDQIYADDVADLLLFMLTDAGRVLIGIDGLPRVGGGETDPHELGPGTRTGAVKEAAFTTVDRRSHLMSLGEYLAMYVFVWSDVLWPRTPAGMPTVDDLVASLTETNDEADVRDAMKHARGTANDFDNVLVFAESLPAVRRVLANVPTYMIFDDHDVTDDWNLYRTFCASVYGNPLGARIVQNALVAYALCQHWGNAPEQFERFGALVPAGRRLLDLLDGAVSYQDVAGLDSLRRIVAVPTPSGMSARSPYGTYHDTGVVVDTGSGRIDSGSLIYSYSIEGPAHQCIVTDSRTWRAYPRTGWGAADLIAIDQLAFQIEQAPPLGGRQALLVMTTNLVPSPAIRQAGRDLPNLPYLGAKHRNDDMFDSWEIERVDFGRLMRTLAKRYAGGDGSVVVLTGDVHTSSAARVQYWAASQVGDSPPAPSSATLVLAQLVASGIHAGSRDTRGQHKQGYGYIPPGFITKVVAQGALLEERLIGWNPNAVAVGQVLGDEWVSPQGIEPSIETLSVLFDPDRPTITLRPQLFSGTIVSLVDGISVPPHYRMLLNYLRADDGGTYHQPPPTLPAPVALAGAVAVANAMAAFAGVRGDGSEIVGRNNICELKIANSVAAHKVHWQEGGVKRWVRFDVALSRTDPRYPMFRYPREP